jgi:hypothetical protein
MKPKSNINWDSPIMRRHGQSLKLKIIEAYCHIMQAQKLRKEFTAVWTQTKPGKC